MSYKWKQPTWTILECRANSSLSYYGYIFTWIRYRFRGKCVPGTTVIFLLQAVFVYLFFKFQLRSTHYFVCAHIWRSQNGIWYLLLALFYMEYRLTGFEDVALKFIIHCHMNALNISCYKHCLVVKLALPCIYKL